MEEARALPRRRPQHSRLTREHLRLTRSTSRLTREQQTQKVPDTPSVRALLLDVALVHADC
jgi:hypothetical protein